MWKIWQYPIAFPLLPKVTISLGITIGYANSAVLPQTLIEAADNALYQAKRAGRNRYILANGTTISSSKV